MSVLLNALLAAASPITPLEPNGPWTVAYEQSMCVAARKYGAKGEASVGFRPGPLSDRMEISIDVDRWPGHLLLQGKAQIRTAPGDRQLDATYRSIWISKHSAHAIIISTTNDVLTDLREGSVVTIEGKPSGTLSVRMTNLAKVRAALADCRNVLLRYWDVDLAGLAKVATLAKPIGDMGSWITSDDYPKPAAQKGERGDTIILWTIGKDGSASDCRVVRSSGTPALDAAACHAIQRSARYEPALDGKGNPVVSWESRRVRWRAFRL
ncbi:energy transducer TonB [Sphingomonas tabacisoli]|uniref:Energy transducer TonB n=1 Tax=Sphingomonas tabacisoli TaxID=2249466 RepID=A0ABW4I5L4_9SPHN